MSSDWSYSVLPRANNMWSAVNEWRQYKLKQFIRDYALSSLVSMNCVYFFQYVMAMKLPVECGVVFFSIIIY